MQMMCLIQYTKERMSYITLNVVEHWDKSLLFVTTSAVHVSSKVLPICGTKMRLFQQTIQSASNDHGHFSWINMIMLA